MVAHPALYAAAARNHRTARQALFYAAENGFIESVRIFLAHGTNPDVMYLSPVPRDCLHRVLTHQGRRRGRQPLIDRKFALEYIPLALKKIDKWSKLAIGYRRLLSFLTSEPNGICSLSESQSYCWLISTLQADVAGCGIEPIVYSSGAETPDALPDSGTPDDASDTGTANQFSDTDTPNDPLVVPRLDFYHWFYWTALHVAAQRGDDELSELLLDSGASIGPLLRCTEPSVLLRSLEFPEDSPYFRDLAPDLQTPLYLAAAGGHCSTTQLLLRYGAPTVVSTCRVTALHVAAAHGVLDVCTFLVENNANPLDGRTDNRLSPFHYAAATGNLQTAGHFLCEKGANIRASYKSNIPGDKKCNAFTHALYAKRYSDALMLLDMDPDFALLEGGQINPLEACLIAPDICGGTKTTLSQYSVYFSQPTNLLQDCSNNSCSRPHSATCLEL